MLRMQSPLNTRSVWASSSANGIGGDPVVIEELLDFHLFKRITRITRRSVITTAAVTTIANERDPPGVGMRGRE